jgi:hypothetical protein
MPRNLFPSLIYAIQFIGALHQRHNAQNDVDIKIQGSKTKYSNKSGVVTYSPSLCHAHGYLRLLAVGALLHRLPLKEQTAHKCSGGTCHGDVVSVAQTKIVRLKNSLEGIQAVDARKHRLDLRSTAVNKELGVDANVVLGKLIDESVLEERLGNGNKHCASQDLEKLHASSADGNPFLGEDCLHNQNAGLESSSDAQAGEDLVSKPFPQRGVDGESRNHTATDGVQNRGWEDEEVVVANDGDEAARDDGHEDAGKEERQDFDTSCDGTNTLNGLKVDGCFTG